MGLLGGVALVVAPGLGRSASAAPPETIEQACFISGRNGLSAGQEILVGYLPGQPDTLRKAFCQLLLFPTASLVDTDAFSSQIVDGSISSDSRHASAEAMTLPSMWWNRDSLTPQLGGRRLVMSWISYKIDNSGRQVIDVMVNPQIWAALSFNERFAVLNQFGTSARSFDYDLRFFHGSSRNQRLAGVYACEPVAPSRATVPLDQLSFEQPDSEPSSGQQKVCAASLDVPRIVQMQRSLTAAGERLNPVAEGVPPHSREINASR
ncbi:MAG: hypothetical protein EA342_18745 [Leptolyngbya sp. LCM1.Bin17]|nr:MAG: hypothetical protein EA342_18745 [Leptolyngbya sp. LCM1.Bin17]